MEIQQKDSALVEIQKADALAIFRDGVGVEDLLSAIKEKACDFTPNISTAKGRSEIASMAHKVARTKTMIDNAGKALVDEYKEIPKKIDATRKRFRDELDALKEMVRQPLTQWEEEERKKAEEIEGKIATIRDAGICNADNSVDLARAVAALEGIQIDESYGDRAGEAAIEKDRLLSSLRERHASAVKAEAERAELERLRKEQEERERKEREARIAEEAAEKARKKAEEESARRELEARLAAERAEKERLAAIARAEEEKKAAVEAERRRIEEQERQAREAEEKRRMDEENRERVHLKIISSLVPLGLTIEQCRAIISAVDDGKIENMSIRY